MPIRRLPEGAEYDPNRVLDAIISKLRLKNDAALARILEVAPPVISKIRHNTLPIGATILLRMHEVSEYSIGELRALMIKEDQDELLAA
jgi:plasmid maintenance system antidote protein VapI